MIIHVLIFKIPPRNSAKPTLIDKSRLLPFSEKHPEISPRNTEEFRADDFVYLAYFAVFLREMKISRLPWLRRNAKYVVLILPGVYITSRPITINNKNKTRYVRYEPYVEPFKQRVLNNSFLCRLLFIHFIYIMKQIIC